MFKRSLFGNVTSRFANDDRQLRFTIEFARQYLIISNAFLGPDDASDVLIKNSGSFPLIGELAFSSLCSR
jgi:hypothetical protein